MHTYNVSCIPQMGICNIAIINKGIKYGNSLFVVSANGPALLGMPDCEQLNLLTVNCQTADDLHRT